MENARYYQTERARAQELELLRKQREEQIQRLHDLHAAGLAVTSDLDLKRASASGGRRGPEAHRVPSTGPSGS